MAGTTLASTQSAGSKGRAFPKPSSSTSQSISYCREISGHIIITIRSRQDKLNTISLGKKIILPARKIQNASTQDCNFTDSPITPPTEREKEEEMYLENGRYIFSCSLDGFFSPLGLKQEGIAKSFFANVSFANPYTFSIQSQ